MMLGVDHIGVGVSDIDRSLAFYGDLGFTEVAWDYSGPLPGLERVAGRPGVAARVLMLRNPRPGVLGLGGVKLVRVTDEPIPPMPDGMAWGEPGICEVCLHARGQADLYRRLTEERGYTGLMEPNDAELDPHGTRVTLSYVADPDGGKVEMLEWLDLASGWPGEQRPEGVNHVAFGVASLERAKEFWSQLDFGGLVFESDGYFEPMHPWYPGEPPRQKMLLLTNPHGAGLEPVEHIPPSPDMRGRWGHLGPYEFAVGVRHLERAIERLGKLGIELRSEPQTIDLGGGASWRYAYFADPDDLYVSLCELRY
jgi:catechol 2,3-dioxygenase-like lactoylglutathione lyase family enzyme